jgi:hypothetical protein
MTEICPLLAQTGTLGMSAVWSLAGARQTLSKPYSAGLIEEDTP